MIRCRADRGYVGIGNGLENWAFATWCGRATAHDRVTSFAGSVVVLDIALAPSDG